MKARAATAVRILVRIFYLRYPRHVGAPESGEAVLAGVRSNRQRRSREGHDLPGRQAHDESKYNY